VVFLRTASTPRFRDPFGKYVALEDNGKVDASNLESHTQLYSAILAGLPSASAQSIDYRFRGGMTASAVSRFPDVERMIVWRLNLAFCSRTYWRG